MDKETEKIIIKGLFKKNMVDRMLFEASKPEYRNKFTSRLSDTGCLDTGYLISLPKPNSNPDINAEQLRGYGAGNTCYIISTWSDYDGKYMPLNEAMDKLLGMGPMIISCIHGRLAFIECEQFRGAPDRYIFRK